MKTPNGPTITYTHREGEWILADIFIVIESVRFVFGQIFDVNGVLVYLVSYIVSGGETNEETKTKITFFRLQIGNDRVKYKMTAFVSSAKRSQTPYCVPIVDTDVRPSRLRFFLPSIVILVCVVQCCQFSGFSTKSGGVVILLNWIKRNVRVIFSENEP